MCPLFHSGFNVIKKRKKKLKRNIMFYFRLYSIPIGRPILSVNISHMLQNTKKILAICVSNNIVKKKIFRSDTLIIECCMIHDQNGKFKSIFLINSALALQTLLLICISSHQIYLIVISNYRAWGETNCTWDKIFKSCKSFIISVVPRTQELGKAGAESCCVQRVFDSSRGARLPLIPRN